MATCETINDSPVVANPSVVLREEFDDWAILYDPDKGDAFGVNPVGVFVWQRLDGKHSTEDIVRELRENCENVPSEAADEVRQFIADLLERGLAGRAVPAA